MQKLAQRADPLLTALEASLRALADCGQGRLAMELAAEAYVALRRDRPEEARRLDVIMHRLARKAPTPRQGDPMSTDTELDVRNEIPARRHELIFETYSNLGAGDAFVLVNDHDPKPLYYQFEAEHNGAFSWDYLEQGPSVWRVRIGRTSADE